MHTPRFFCPVAPVIGQLFDLPANAAHHAVRVLRLTVGDGVMVFDGSGAEWPAQIAHIEAGRCRLAVAAARFPLVESPLAVVLGQGLTQADKYDLVLQKAVELGVAGVTALALQRSVVRLDGERAAKRHAHWQAVASAACEQCGRVRLPLIEPVSSLAHWIAGLPADSLRLHLGPEAALSVADLPAPTGAVALAVGPEGGFTDEEVAQLTAAGFLSVRLGPRILRTETAALAALAALQSWHGDFRPTPL